MRITKSKQETFKKELLILLNLLSIRLYGKSAMSKYSSNSFRQDIVDVSSDDIEDKICISLSGKEKEIIVKIERALEKMEEGSYGICDVTGEAIPIGRLEAIPYATMTVGAQRDMESNNYSDGF